MRKLIVSMMVSLDGFIEDENASIEWHVWDEEMDAYMLQFFEDTDTLLFGRKTYQLMEAFWPTELALNESPGIREKMNGLPKLVFSKTLNEANWATTTLLKELNPSDLQAMKAAGGKDMVIFGGAELVQSFQERNLIDEYRIIVNPVILGSGKALFGNGQSQVTLQLLQTKTFACGNVLLCYAPKSKQHD